MANVRAEILAASRSRTGWKDLTRSNPSNNCATECVAGGGVAGGPGAGGSAISERKPLLINSLKLNFESKTANTNNHNGNNNNNDNNSFNRSNSMPNTNSVPSSSTLNSASITTGRKLGTKVSQIANLFQSMSPQTSEPNLLSLNGKRQIPQKSNSLASVNVPYSNVAKRESMPNLTNDFEDKSANSNTNGQILKNIKLIKNRITKDETNNKEESDHNCANNSVKTIFNNSTKINNLDKRKRFEDSNINDNKFGTVLNGNASTLNGNYYLFVLILIIFL